jgi:EpsI family protein
MFQSRQHRINVQAGKYINIMTMSLVNGESKILASYFFFQRGRVITSPWMNKFYLMWDAFTRRRTDGALVRVEMVLAPNQSIEEAYPVLDDFIVRLWGILPDYVPM